MAALRSDDPKGNAPVETEAGPTLGAERRAARPRSPHEAVLDRCEMTPGRTAIEDEFGVWDYGRLGGAVHAFAKAILGHAPGCERVVVWSAKRAEVVAAVIAAHAVGASVCILDDTQPFDRVRSLVELVRPDVVLVARDVDTRWAVVSTTTPVLDLLAELPAGAPRPARAERRPRDPAYVYFTSGSTAGPKGVEVAVETVEKFVSWGAETLGVGPDDVLASCSSLSAAITMFDTYVPLVSGASVRLVPRSSALEPAHYLSAARDATIWLSVPAILGRLVAGSTDRAPRRLRAVCYFGEAAQVEVLRQVAAWTGAAIINMYGATEVVGCFYHRVTADDIGSGSVPIGVPVLGNTAALQDVEAGGVGELVVDGPSVLVRYVGGRQHRGAYATGDLAVQTPDGLFRLVGRADLQRNLHGQRLHLGEIEAATGTVAGVRTAAADVVEGTDGPVLGLVVEPSDPDVTPMRMRSALASILPLAWRPGTVLVVPAVPRLPNGKLDRGGVRRVLEDHERVR